MELKEQKIEDLDTEAFIDEKTVEISSAVGDGIALSMPCPVAWNPRQSRCSATRPWAIGSRPTS